MKKLLALALFLCSFSAFSQTAVDQGKYNLWYGSHAQRLTLTPTRALDEYQELDTGNRYRWYGNNAGAGTWLLAAVPVSASGSPTDSYNITPTVVTVGTTSTQLIAANSLRKYLAWQTVGTQTVTCTPGAGPAVVGSGFPYTGAGTNLQGASQEFPHGAPYSAFQCIASASGSVVIVWEGQ